MKKGLFLRVTAVLLIICMTAGLALTAAADYPTPVNNVYDGTGTLSDSVIETIKSTNDTLSSKVNAKISLCIVESLGGEDIAAYSKSVFNEWKLGEGVLLVVSTGDENYYAVQSVGIDDILTNEQLSAILQNFMEPDFAEGNVALGIQKTINKLSGFMKSELPAAGADTAEDEKKDGDKEEEGKVTFGSIIGSIGKILLWTVGILVAAFVIFFVAALFNDTAAELMQRYVFSHFTGNSSTSRNDYYDERLYGNPRSGGNRQLQSGNGQQKRLPPPDRQYDRYRQGGVRYDDEYYGGQYGNRNNQNGQYNRQGQYGQQYNRNGQRPNKYQQYANQGQSSLPQYNYQGQANRQSQQGSRSQQRPQQNRYSDDYGYTQQYTINRGQRNNNGNRY